jgi:Tfp pilus assembly protein PilF
MSMIDNLENMLATGKETALLRYSLGAEYLKLDDFAKAIPHLRRAVELDEQYSAAWKLLGKAYAGAERARDAIDAYTRGIAVAEQKGDKQAVKEMQVFLRRLEKSS